MKINRAMEGHHVRSDARTQEQKNADATTAKGLRGQRLRRLMRPGPAAPGSCCRRVGANHAGIASDGQAALAGVALLPDSSSAVFQFGAGKLNSSVNHGIAFFWNTVSRMKSTTVRTDHFFATSRWKLI